MRPRLNPPLLRTGLGFAKHKFSTAVSNLLLELSRLTTGQVPNYIYHVLVLIEQVFKYL